MNQLTKTFEGQNVRILGSSDNPLFVLKDVCKVLGIIDSKTVKARLDDEVVSNHPILDSLNRQQQITVINEEGLYEVLFDSRKPEAKRFRKWVTSEVLPSIRKHGAYMTDETLEQALQDPNILLKLVQNYKEEHDKRLQAEEVIIQQQPLVDFANTVGNEKRGILIRDFAKLISKEGFAIGEKRLFQWLREKGYLTQNNRPYQRYIDMGVLELIERPIVKPTGTDVAFTPKITGRGQEYFLRKLREDIKGVG